MRTCPTVGISAILLLMSYAHVHGAYCTAAGGGDEYIYQVQVGNINNNATAASGYADYTATHSTVMEPNVAYPVTIVTAVGTTPYSGYAGDQLGIWVDWNADQVFSEPNETVCKIADYALIETSITPPAGTTPGSKRMRVRLTYTGAVSPCGTTTYGEVEDYTIVVNDPNACRIVQIGTESISWGFPMYTYYHDCRTQAIYLAGEIGGGGLISGLGLNLLTVPGQIMNNWTIRMKHTSLNSYSAAAFEPSGWTVVYQGNEPVGAAGWRQFSFAEPFIYNGTDNLLVDFSFNNSSWTSAGNCAASSCIGSRTMIAFSDSNHGDPLTWPTTPPPTASLYSRIPNVRLTVCQDTAVTISGRVATAEGVGVKGINISVDGVRTAATDSTGYYELRLPNPFSGNVTFSQTDWTFSPSARAYANISSDQTNQNSTGTYTVLYGGGAGTLSLPYLIYNAAQFNRIGTRLGDWSKHFKLMADIDLSGYDGHDGRPCVNRIGYNNIGSAAFTGVFDGNGCTISNFTDESDLSHDAVGLFGYIGSLYGSPTQIKNLRLTNVHVVSGSTLTGTGALIGEMDDGTVDHCSVEGGIVTGGDYDTGGLVGGMVGGVLSNCSAEVSVSGGWSVGGLAGDVSFESLVSNCTAACAVTGKIEIGGLIGGVGSSSSIITRCSSSGSVILNYSTMTDRTAGGLVGDHNGTIEACYSTASVSGGSGNEIGGLVGRQMGIVSNCFSRGAVSGGSSVGGLAGLCWDGTVDSSYSTGAVSGVSNKGGLIGRMEGTSSCAVSFWDTQTSGLATSAGGTGKTTTQMKDINVFLEAGWDFVDETLNGTVDLWYMPEGGYPNLWWVSGIKYGGGTGTPEDPFVIYTAAQLAQIGTEPGDWDCHFKLMSDIDMGGYAGGLALIGTYESPFSGTFDGQGHAIRQFNYTSTGKNYAGIFEYVDGAAARIENLTVADSTFSAGANGTGMIVGVLKNGTMLNCRTDNCAVSGNFYVGGIAGRSYGVISSCSSKNGTVYGSSQLVGGITGRNEGTVTNSYSRCAISAGSSYAGGIAGENKGTISNCYSTGTVTVGSAVGGIVFLNTGTVTGCYWDYLTSQVFFSNGGTMKTTTQMKTLSTFTGWDFVNTWAICPGTNYPRLQWEISTADWVCPDGIGLADLNHLASWWLVTGCAAQSDCAGADLDLSGQVGLNDLAAFAQYWMQ